jgi:threonylcarbamoyladenosine tRNA methylthiotransferase MtaB
MKLYFDMVGCKVNQAEIESFAAEALARGHEITADAGDADLAVLNTCTVTGEAERDSRSRARAVAAANPAVRIALTGCWATLAPEPAGRLPRVEWVIPNAEKDGLIGRILGGESPAPGAPDPTPIGGVPRAPLQGRRHRTRAFIKVQDGCDNACAYCITRFARGAAHSRPAEDVVRELHAAERGGAQEAVLAGIHLGAWGSDRGEPPGLDRLLAEVLARTRIPRIRLSSLEPWDLRPEFFRLWEDPRLCPHLHLPLQSGCAATLRRMARRTTPAQYAALVEQARAAIPDLALTTDWMVGFPGESVSEFRESLAFVERMQFARIHVFHFSPRPGTPAEMMSSAVPSAEFRRRMRAAQADARAAAEAFARRFVGREMDVLWNAEPSGGEWRGLTGNYLEVRMRSETRMGNTISRARLLAAADGWLDVAAVD